MKISLLLLFPLLNILNLVNSRYVQTFSSSALTCGHTQQVGRVLGGDEASFGEFPWITSIQSSEGQHFCAGFMVSKRYLISAAHCFHRRFNDHLKYREDDDGIILDSLKVAVSRVNLSDSNKHARIVQVKKLIIHPQFDDTALNNDIAIIELHNDQEWSKGLSPICLPEVAHEDHGNGDVTVAGWGYRQCGTLAHTSNELHKITVPLWNADTCKKSYEDADYNFNRRDYVCAGSDGKDITKGDSGGPLMFRNAEKRWTAIGIVSSGKFMCSDRVPGVYTKVSSYLEWIRDQIK